MDLSSFSTLSVEERQALDDVVMEAKREAVQENVDQELAAAKEHATAIAQEEADRRESTQA